MESNRYIVNKSIIKKEVSMKLKGATLSFGKHENGEEIIAIFSLPIDLYLNAENNMISKVIGGNIASEVFDLLINGDTTNKNSPFLRFFDGALKLNKKIEDAIVSFYMGKVERDLSIDTVDFTVTTQLNIGWG